ncbi:hypothetical protein RclHR1_13680003 [Rhizophagus clarus]|uniref:Uncharacterized protein n=1 Tax=Rhizophagus clarus TaxID=94130 RepID=A0A2Z6QAQ6_9GLOM|nr:hypothetical protein RclHR1_13680003 [Rhizophagus clarus]
MIDALHQYYIYQLQCLLLISNIIIKKIRKKYGTPLNSEIYIPSNEYIRLQFWPGIVTANAASKYTGRFEIKYKVQSRQLSKFHADAHYCAALFRYMRLFAIKYRNYCSLICADDKHKVPIGEGIVTTSGVRNKPSLVPANMELTSSDHDFTKLSLTPSVIFFCDIPTCISDSFYSGQVYIKKCGNDDCKFCLPIRLPKEIFDELKFIPDPMLSTDLEHYQDFDKLYGTKTREYLPSASGSMKENIPVGIINNSNIRKLANCTVCNKPRCIFGKNALSDEEKTSLEILLDNVIYICGSPITPEMHDLYEKVYVRQKIYCNSPIEAVYYSCRHLKTEIICFYCGDENELLEPDDNLKKKFTTIYPFCQICKDKGYNWPTRGRIKVGN